MGSDVTGINSPQKAPFRGFFAGLLRAHRRSDVPGLFWPYPSDSARDARLERQSLGDVTGINALQNF
jgi:hypothetical protein